MNQEPPTAFPWTHDNMTCTGMTLRDYFAAKAMQGLCSTLGGMLPSAPTYWSVLAFDAYEMADAMMKARKA